jgi:hypothetical protein
LTAFSDGAWLAARVLDHVDPPIIPGRPLPYGLSVSAFRRGRRRMVKMSYPESSVGPEYRAECCGSTIQSLHRYHIDRCECGRSKITGGAVAPRLICSGGDATEQDGDPATSPMP